MGFFSMFSNKNEQAAQNDQISGLKKGRAAAYGQLDKGLAGLTGQYGTARSEFDPLQATYNKGSQSYADALGLNGPEGNTRATAQFQTGPGYQFAVQQAQQGILRNQSATGMLGSGNTDIALQDRGNQLANQEYGSYLDRLGGYDAKAMSVAGARAGIDTGLGNQILGVGRDKAQIGWNTETGTGQARANYQLGKDRTSANIFGAITGGLSLGAKLLGAGGGGVTAPFAAGLR